MSNTNRDYAIIYDIKNSSLILSRPLVFYITDRNTSNIFVRLVTKVNIGDGVDQYTDIEEASSYALTMRVIKPNNEVNSIEATQHEEASIFQFDLTEDFKDIPGKYICELTISTIVSERQELITSDPFNYEVKRSILSNVSEIIETEDTTVEKLLNNLEASKIRLFNDLELAKTNLHNDLNATSSALNSQVQASNNKIKNIKEELSLQVQTNNNKIENIKGELSSQIKDITSGTIIIKTNGEDDSDVIQNALNEGYDIVIKGDVYTTKKIIISKPNQSIIQQFGTWYVKHVDDDAIHILSYNNKIKCNFSGEKQPSGKHNISCIVVGQGGTEAAERGRSCDLSYTQIKNYQGNGVRWINGARINTFYLEIYQCKGHGFFADIGCKDNNDGNFDNMSVVNCSEYGIYFKEYKSEDVADDVISDGVGSRQSGNNTFRNTKGFGNKINFVIETGLNVGTIFSEDAVDNYDIFSGNHNTIKYLGCIESSNNFRNTGDNEIEFLDSFNHNNRDKFRSKKIIISDTYSGNMEISQTGNNAFLDTITDTFNEVVVKHTKGTASLRTDEFDVIKIGNSSFKFIHQKKIQLSNQVVEAGRYITIDYGESFAVPYSTILKQFVVLNQESDLIVTAVVRRESSGWCRPLIKIFNPTKQNIILSDLSSIDYCAYA